MFNTCLENVPILLGTENANLISHLIPQPQGDVNVAVVASFFFLLLLQLRKWSSERSSDSLKSSSQNSFFS